MASSPGAVDGQHNISSQISGHHPIFFRKFIFIYFYIKKIYYTFFITSHVQKKKEWIIESEYNHIIMMWI